MKWRRNFLRVMIVVAILLLLSPLAARFLIVRQSLEKPQAIVVLSGAATFVERTRYAAKLFKEGRADRIILTNDNMQSGWSQTQQRNPYYYERAMDELVRSGVPRENIELTNPQVADTHDEAQRLRDYCNANRIGSLLVVTSSYHSRRAFAIFSDVFKGSGVDLGIEPAPTGLQTPSPLIWWLYPSGWQMVPGEYVKMVYYLVEH